MIRKFKIAGLPTEKEFAAMPFGRSLDTLKAFQQFKTTAKVVWLSQKRQSYAKAIKDAIKLYDVKEYYCSFECDTNRMVYDDSFEFFYKENNNGS